MSERAVYEKRHSNKDPHELRKALNKNLKLLAIAVGKHFEKAVDGLFTERDVLKEFLNALAPSR